MSISLPQFWVHNSDGTCDQRGGTPQQYRGRVSGVMGRPVGGDSQSPRCSEGMLRHVVTNGSLLHDATYNQFGQKVVRICDACQARNILKCYHDGPIDVCMDCARSLLQNSKQRRQEKTSPAVIKSGQESAPREQRCSCGGNLAVLCPFHEIGAQQSPTPTPVPTSSQTPRQFNSETQKYWKTCFSESKP